MFTIRFNGIKSLNFTSERENSQTQIYNKNAESNDPVKF